MKKEYLLSKKLYNNKQVTRIRKKLIMLGKPDLNTYNFLNKKYFTTSIFFISILFIFNLGFIFAPILTIIYFYMFEKILLDERIKKRTFILESDALNFFETLTLSIETGRNLEEGLKATILSVDNTLSKEFQKTLDEIKFGKSLTEALQNMSNRIPSESINNIIATLTQANIFGNSIVTTLYTQLDFLREKRKMEIKSQIAKMPIKISIISVLFFIPLLMLIILGPIILNYLG